MSCEKTKQTDIEHIHTMDYTCFVTTSVLIWLDRVRHPAKSVGRCGITNNFAIWHLTQTTIHDSECQFCRIHKTKRWTFWTWHYFYNDTVRWHRNSNPQNTLCTNYMWNAAQGHRSNSGEKCSTLPAVGEAACNSKSPGNQHYYK